MIWRLSYIPDAAESTNPCLHLTLTVQQCLCTVARVTRVNRPSHAHLAGREYARLCLPQASTNKYPTEYRAILGRGGGVKAKVAQYVMSKIFEVLR